MSEENKDHKAVDDVTVKDPAIDPSIDEAGKDPETPGNEKDLGDKEPTPLERENARLFARAKAAEEKNKEREEAEKKAMEAKLLEDEKYQEVIANKDSEINEFKSKAEKLTGLEGDIDTLWENLKEQIDPEKLSLVPDSLPSIEKIKYVNANREHLFESGTPGIGSKTPKGDKEVPLDESDKVKARYEELIKTKRETGFLSFKESQEVAKLGRELKNLNN